MDGFLSRQLHFPAGEDLLGIGAVLDAVLHQTQKVFPERFHLERHQGTLAVNGRGVDGQAQTLCHVFAPQHCHRVDTQGIHFQL